jgi:hypothetical protein
VGAARALASVDRYCPAEPGRVLRSGVVGGSLFGTRMRGLAFSMSAIPNNLLGPNQTTAASTFREREGGLFPPSRRGIRNPGVREMRKTMILGAALAAMLISVLPAEAGLFSGMRARRAARQAAMSADDGGCYSSQYAAAASACSTAGYASAACPTGNCPQTVGYAAPSYGYSYAAPSYGAVCPTGNCPQASTYAPAPAIQYVYTTAPAPAPTITSTVATTCDENGDGRCDKCGHSNVSPPPLGRRPEPTPTVRLAAVKPPITKPPIAKPPDPIAPPIAYTPPAETMLAFR